MRARPLSWAFVIVVGCGEPAHTSASVAIAPLPSPSAQPQVPGEPPPPVRPTHVRIDKTITLPDCVWVIVEARDEGNKMTSNTEFDTETKKTEGRFIVVRYKLTNAGTKEEMLLDRPKIVDQRGRAFGPIDMESFYVPKDAKVIGLEALVPNVTREFWTVVELPTDSTNLKLEVHGFSLLGEKKLVPLGL